MAKKLREPNVENKYNLKPSDISKLKILDRSKIKEPLFWRNDVIDAWCITKTIGSYDDHRFCDDNSMWIGIYDETAKSYAGRIRSYCTSYGGMCGYDFNTFFDYTEIENEKDLQTQEALLKYVNQLIDEGILGLPK